MDNPFKKRATEYFADPAALLSVLSPEPLRKFFEGNAASFFDRLTIVVGTPGSGKTTIARLIELDTVVALLRSLHSRDHKELAQALGDCEVVDGLRPKILAFRLATGSDLRDIWELPYSEKVRSGLLRSLIQARAVLGWLRKLEGAGVDLGQVKIIAREQFEVPASLIHVESTLAFRDYARSVEERIFKVITALVPPREEQLIEVAPDTTYEAFQIIESFLVPPIAGIEGESTSLRPLCILDDAHELHPDQFSDIEQWLRGREIKIARWLMTRVDAIGTDMFRKALSSTTGAQAGTTPERDWVLKLMQREGGDKRAFKATVKDISRRYIEQMPALHRRLVKLEDCLAANAPQLSTSQMKELQKSVDVAIQDTGFPKTRVQQISSWIPQHVQDDERQVLLRILLYREARRTPQSELFGTEEHIAETVSDQRGVSSALITGANIQLMHEFGKPFYYSFDRLADASGENIEQFINLAGALVNNIETLVLRGRQPRLDAKTQHSILAERAKKSIDSWNFPHSNEVKLLVNFIAERCKERTLASNAPLDDGANAFGIPQEDMDRFQDNGGDLVHVLHYALAYNALTLRENYECKRRPWCLFQLGGLPILVNGLTFNKGGFCEGRLSDLVASVSK